jgi:hypothetical protein
MAFLFALAAAALAPNVPPPADSSAIVVQGVRDPARAARDYVDKVLPRSFDFQLGRFEEPVCAGSVGLPPNLGAEVLSRISTVARVAGIPVAASGCRANLLVVVVDDKKAFIEGLRRKKEAYLYGVGEQQIGQLEKAPGPVAAWQVSDVIGADGIPLRTDGDGFPRLFTTMPPSRIVSTTRKRLLGAVVVIEQRGLVDISTRQLADYALVRAMAPIEPRSGSAPSSSVLSLFDGGLRPADAPQSLTWWDLAFLKALFATRSDTVASIQGDEIRSRMRAEMAKLLSARQ